MTLLRVVILAMAMALATMVIGWWVVPVLAAVYGFLVRGTGRPGVEAALAGGLSWGGYLSILAFGGAPVGAFGGDLALAMGLPSWAPHVATVVFPALLAAPAAFVASQVGRRPTPRGPVRR